jgi:hypothetical protein
VSARQLPVIRALYSRLPELRNRLPWESRILLWSLGYTDELESAAESAAATPVARKD